MNVFERAIGKDQDRGLVLFTDPDHPDWYIRKDTTKSNRVVLVHMNCAAAEKFDGVPYWWTWGWTWVEYSKQTVECFACKTQAPDSISVLFLFGNSHDS